MSIQEIEQLSITILMDNTTDLLLKSSEHAVRPPSVRNERFVLPTPVAEHGFSAMVNVLRHNQSISNSFLFDTGVSKNGVIHNADVYGINFSKIDGIILSHGHLDHFAGLVNIIKRISSLRRQASANNIDVFTHPDAFLRRWEIFPDGTRVKSPVLGEQRLQQLGAIIHKNTSVTYLPSKESPFLLVTGEIPRETSFEKGFPYQYAEDPTNEKNLIPDPLIRDDQALVVNISGKGLVILTGCGHAGVINTINYAKKITGIDRIHAIIGGFHLPADGGIFEVAIEPTLKEFQKAQPDYLVPCHCTGWKATNRIIETMPEKFIQSSVGTIFQF
ncbi:MAG TPA: MBL fold metallo-hydrolase [Nitrososphaeraceae archaeon]|jgi:7,8-dihydropterin-6-yl-methyl-4-(beta-D-ribofuranosyl)aminobenzene 5'-phosphate synthase|nr:MBL fold metallo-hydrolase [Nitrososphaeraceae archaeon]